MKKVRNVETWFKGETNPSCCRGKGAMVVEKDEREKSTQENTQEHFPIATGLENERD